jgi:hypothetical protein
MRKYVDGKHRDKHQAVRDDGMIGGMSGPC